MKSSLAVAALEDAMRKRGKPKGVIVHSDRGLQFDPGKPMLRRKPTVRKARCKGRAWGSRGDGVLFAPRAQQRSRPQTMSDPA